MQLQASNSNSSLQSSPEAAMSFLSHHIRRMLEWEEQRYIRVQEENRKQHGHPRVEALKKYVEEIEEFCEAEILANRLGDTPEFWAQLYSHVLVSVSAKKNALIGEHAFYLWRTGTGRAGEQATFAEMQRELSRFVAKIERKLIDTLQYTLPLHAKDSTSDKPSGGREAMMLNLVEQKGWSFYDWAMHSRLDPHTVYAYVRGKRKTYKSTRKKLADALGIDVEELPI